MATSMEIENKVLSEVHIFSNRSEATFKNDEGETTDFSRFFYILPINFAKNNCQPNRNSSSCSKCRPKHVSSGSVDAISGNVQSHESSSRTYVDEDGDQVVCRKSDERYSKPISKVSYKQKHSSQNHSESHSNVVDQSRREKCDTCHESHESFEKLFLPREGIACSSCFQNIEDGNKTCDSFAKNSTAGSQTEQDFALEVMTVEHKMETVLGEVGFQVWSGALLLCDYLIDHSFELEEATILDLGAGTGITSITAGMFAPCVLCTDYRVDIMELAERNWQRNKDFLPQVRCKQMSFKVLDWLWDYPPPTVGLPEITEGKYAITSEDLGQIEQSTIILGAEVIYDDDLTDAFFKIIYFLLVKPPSKSVFVAVEKRIIFSAECNEIASPAYEHFVENLEDLTTIDEGPATFTAEQISTEFPQYFQYRRHKEMELWKISSQFPE